MHHGRQISQFALILAAGLAATPASAQTAANINSANLLSGFSLLDNTAAGRNVLSQNLNTSIAINNNSSQAVRAQAISDNTIASLVGSTISRTAAQMATPPISPQA
jgi:hypothetical protein